MQNSLFTVPDQPPCAHRDVMDIQVVAFPQEGIVKGPESASLLEAALQMGADVLDGMSANQACPDDSRTQVRKRFDLTEEYGGDVDMHVDETDDPFFRTLEMIADEAIARGYTGHRVTAGHTCALAAYDDHYARYVIDKVARAEMNIVTNPLSNRMLQGREDKQPIQRRITRVKELLAAGVNVTIGEDNLNDVFNPLGDGVGTSIAGLFGGPANCTYSENTGVMVLTRVYDPKVTMLAGCFSIALSFLSIFDSFINMIPAAVLGGISLLLYGSITNTGIRMMVEEGVDFNKTRNIVIIAVMLISGLGFELSPITLSTGTSSFEIGGLAVAAVFGILANLLLPGNDYEFPVEAIQGDE